MHRGPSGSLGGGKSGGGQGGKEGGREERMEIYDLCAYATRNIIDIQQRFRAKFGKNVYTKSKIVSIIFIIIVTFIKIKHG